MDKREIVEKALKGVGKQRVQGDTTEPIMPYLLADVMYQLYLEDIPSYPLRHEMKRMSTLWRERYKHFNKPLFSQFHPTEFTEITDLMDDVYESLHNEIVMLRSNIMTMISGIESFNTRHAVSTLIMCHIFAQYADCSYQRVYYNTKIESFGIIEEPASNQDLCYLRDLSYKMALRLIKDSPGGELELKETNMGDIFKVIAKKIYQWLKEN